MRRGGGAVARAAGDRAEGDLPRAFVAEPGDAGLLVGRPCGFQVRLGHGVRQPAADLGVVLGGGGDDGLHCCGWSWSAYSGGAAALKTRTAQTLYSGIFEMS